MLGFSTDVYDTLKFLHVLAAVVWVGGGLLLQYQATRLTRAGDPHRLVAFAHDAEKAGNHVFMPASLVALLMGISMVLYSPGLGFTTAWILIGLIGYAATFVTGAFFLGPTAGKLGRAMEAEGPESPAVQGGIARIIAISRIDAVVLILVIADMVFKPGR
jgi:uncharacterized membrane protein